MKQAKRLFWNAILMTAAALLMRTVGVSFQVYVSNRVGAEAMGLFSLMAGVYGFALTLATSGIHLGVTRVVADALGEERPSLIAPAMRRALFYAASFGILASVLLSFGASFIGKNWLHDTRTVTSLRLFAITLPLISISSALNGYFVAVRRVYKNAAVQVTEQAVKIGATMYLLGILMAGGIEKTCCALVLGGTVAEVLSCILSAILYLLDRKRRFPSDAGTNADGIGKKLVGISLPIAFTAYMRSGLITLEHVLIPRGLRKSGSSHAASLIAYGSIHSMALPVILYPAALISSFSGLLVPELAECHIVGSQKRIRYMISRVWSLSMLFSIGVAGILICFSGELGEALYPGTDTGAYIRILAPLIPIMYVDTATDAMMKGLGEHVFSMKINIADALISVILVWLLVPRLGIAGYVITIYFSETFNTVFSISHLLSISRPQIRVFKWVYKPLFCIVAATSAVRFGLPLLGIRLAPSGMSLTMHFIAVLSLYLLLLILTGGIEKEDRIWMEGLLRREKSGTTETACGTVAPQMRREA